VEVKVKESARDNDRFAIKELQKRFGRIEKEVRRRKEKEPPIEVKEKAKANKELANHGTKALMRAQEVELAHRMESSRGRSVHAGRTKKMRNVANCRLRLRRLRRLRRLERCKRPFVRNKDKLRQNRTTQSANKVTRVGVFDDK
jgi:hypothetical protein